MENDVNAGSSWSRIVSGNHNAKSVNLPCFVPKSAAAEVAALPEMTDSQRAELAEKLGYRSIGKELPSDVTLSDVIKSLPEDVGGARP